MEGFTAMRIDIFNSSCGAIGWLSAVPVLSALFDISPTA